MSEGIDVPAPLTPLEIASGSVVGSEAGVVALPAYDGRSPRASLEASLLSALQRPGPCIVPFSGGRDSSAMLALGMHLARSEGLALPLPLTLRYPGAPETHEDQWQQLVIEHLGITEWQRVAIDDELDIIGPYAQATLRAHGVLYPLNAHTFGPMLPFARGGTLVTGIDGDGLLDDWGYGHTAALLGRQRRPEPRDVLRLGLHAGPRSMRSAVFAHRLKPHVSWLTSGAEATSRRGVAAEMADEPRRWDQRVSWWRARRYLRLTMHSGALAAADAGVSIVHPLLDDVFLSAMAHTGGRRGPGDRSAVMRDLVGDLLPDAVLARETKATFQGPFFNRYAREFAKQWNGEFVDRTYVDPVRLRAAWHGPRVPVASALLLQATWLAAQS